MNAAFKALGLNDALAAAASALGHGEPTAIQAASIPAALAGRDLLASAPTGSGKTIAFALPLLQRCDAPVAGSPRRTQALILVPTRELAAQVGEVLNELLALVRAQAREPAGRLAAAPKVVVAFGGVSINPQMMALRGGADVIVATPGRLLDLAAHNAVRLSHVAMLVLDEADRLLDEGFADEWARIAALLPPRRQNLLFSATLPASVQTLAQGLLRDPLRIDVPADAHEEAPDIHQRAIEVDEAHRTALLHHLLIKEGWTRVLVFVATQFACERVAHKLRKLDVTAEAFHGELSQGARTQALADFKIGALQVLVATDVASRGIDIANLPVVVNYDLPRSAVDFVHRIGRTGRAGANGLAVSFISAGKESHFRLIEKRQQRRVPREQVAGFEPKDAATANPGASGVKGKRKSKKDKLREAAARGE